jgi:hypothetical protein
LASDIGPNPAKFRDGRAVREAKRLLKLEFLHQCAGGIAVHAGLVQTFAEIGDPSGACYALRQLFAHVRPRIQFIWSFAMKPLPTRGGRHDRAG